MEELPIQVWRPDHTLQNITITDSPYYRSLQTNDPAIFLAYQRAMRGLASAPSEISWDQFLDLRNDVADNGLRDTGEPITLNDEGQLDGHHRLAILCHLYGPRAEVRLANGVVTFPAK